MNLRRVGIFFWVEQNQERRSQSLSKAKLADQQNYMYCTHAKVVTNLLINRISQPKKANTCIFNNFSFRFCQSLMEVFGDIVWDREEDKRADDGWTNTLKRVITGRETRVIKASDHLFHSRWLHTIVVRWIHLRERYHYNYHTCQIGSLWPSLPRRYHRAIWNKMFSPYQKVVKYSWGL